MIFEPRDYPTTPGCYLMRDAGGGFVYIGKATNVRRRLVQHLKPRVVTGRTERLRATVESIEVMVTRTEREALLLESNLIKHHRPLLNATMVDEEDGYYFIALTSEPLPRLLTYRKHRINPAVDRAGGPAALFGPYVSRRHRDWLMDFVSDRFSLRTCHPLADRTCVRFDLGYCGGVCERHVDAAGYAKAVRAASTFLRAPTKAAVNEVRAALNEAVASTEFELAALLRDRLEALDAARQPQAVDRPGRGPRGATSVAFTDDDGHTMVAALVGGAVVSMAYKGPGEPIAAKARPDRDLTDLLRLNLANRRSRLALVDAAAPPEPAD